MKRKKGFLIGVGALALLTSCAPPTIKTTALLPARSHEASLLKEVAVLSFDGPDGHKFASEVEAILASINVSGGQYFSVVDRMKLDKVLQEMKLAKSGLVDENTAMKVGKLVGARGIYTGVVTQSRVDDREYKEKRTRCASYATRYDKKGKVKGEDCIRWEEYTVSCTNRVATFAFTAKLIDVEKGRIVYANNLLGTAESSACSDSSKPLASRSELIETAKQYALAEFRKDVAPHYSTFEIKLMNSKEGITSDAAKKKFEQGIDFAKHNRMDRACELWGEANTLSPNAPSILYNLGICFEITGQFEQALDLYKKADRAYGKPDDRITSALQRVSGAIEKQKKLKEQIR